MADEPFSDTQLAMLERRWKRDPSAHLSLQLADLYRQRKRLGDALPVLERALEEQPRYVSLQVALGRYRLEAGDAAGAAEVLSDVVQRDAGHLVANKLLVKAYLALGDATRASDRLELYAVLNDGDPELAALRAAVGRTAPFSAVRPASATDLGAIAPPAGRSLAGALDRAPFANLADRPLRPASLAAIFAGIDERWEAEAAAPATAETSSAPAPEAAVPPVPPEPEVVPEPPSAATYETRYFAYEETAADVASDAGPDAAPAGERPAPRELDPGAGATATLGALYLSQGHLDDARRTFEQVLERDPDDGEARAGLEEIERRRAPAAVEAAPRAATPGAHQVKIEALRGYLGRIRAAAERLSA